MKGYTMTVTLPRTRRFARLSRWLASLQSGRAADLRTLSDRMLKDVGFDGRPLDQRSIRSQHDAMRYSG
jgi:hypothetical protein